MKIRLFALLLAALLLAGGCAERPAASSQAGETSSAQTSAEPSQPSSQDDASTPESGASDSSSGGAESAVSETGDASSAGESTTVSTNGVTQGALPESPRVEDSYFDDAVFIGDSVSLKLNLYVTKNRQSNPTLLGKAQFLTAGSMGSGNALQPVSDDSIHPLYNGEKMSLADSVAASGAKKVYIMLGMNDLAVYGVDGAVANMETLLNGILEKTPDAKIFIETATPLVKAKSIETNKLNNTNVRLYNEKLAELCAKNGWYLVDISSAVQDSEGNLNASYCSDPDDMGIHFTDEGCKVWIDYLYTHTPQ